MVIFLRGLQILTADCTFYVQIVTNVSYDICRLFYLIKTTNFVFRNVSALVELTIRNIFIISYFHLGHRKVAIAAFIAFEKNQWQVTRIPV